MRRRLRAWAALLAIATSAGSLYAQSLQPVIAVSEQRAVALALEHNLGLAAARLQPQVADLDVAKAGAAWTPEFVSTLANTHAIAPSASLLTGSQAGATDNVHTSQFGVVQRLRWGTQYSLTWDAGSRTSNNLFSRFNPQLTSALTIQVSQPLGRGLAIDAARAEADTAVILRQRADVQLDAAVATTVRRATRAYWQWAYASDVLEVERESLRLAQELLQQNRERVRTGAMAAVDLVEAQAEVARRDEAILVAAKDVLNAEDTLRRIILEPGIREFEASFQRLSGEDPPVDKAPIDADLSFRQDVRAARNVLSVDDVSMRLLRNDTRPDVTVAVSYSAQSVGGDELVRAGGFPGTVVGTASRGFSAALADLVSGRYPTWSAQLSVSYPLGATRADAALAQATIERRRHETAVRDAELTARTELSIAQREAETSRQRITSTQTAVDLAAKRLDGEQRKFTAGLSTSFFVFQAQRDLALAREAALRAMLDYRHARADLAAVRVVPLGLDQPVTGR